MSNEKIGEERVKWRSLKKYNCKRNKGEHEFLDPVLLIPPYIRYTYKTETSCLSSHELHPEHKFLKAMVHVYVTTTCKHCGKKINTFFIQKLY